MTAPIDSSILHEIVRVIDARSAVPEKVRIRGRDYQITYLDDHRQRMEEAIRRHDPDRLSMLYGQLASKVKYQLLRQSALQKAAAAKRAASSAKVRPSSAKKATAARKRPQTAKKVTGAKKRTVSRAARRSSGAKRR